LAPSLYEAMELPHPPISPRILLVIEEAIRIAWELLREHPRPGFDLSSVTEDPLTHELYEVLCDVVFKHALVKGFNRRLLRAVAREPKVRSYNRASLDKMPDLAIALMGREAVAIPTQDGLFIECKPVDTEHSVGKYYCGKGLVRFVNGDYAWAMREAMMVGYAREGYTISPKLVRALGERADTVPTVSYPRPCPHSKATPVSEPVQISMHRRTFAYVETSRQAPPITIRHLWLKRG